MIEEAKSNAAAEDIQPTFLRMDSHHLEFADDHFDLILSRNVTWNQYNPEGAYREWYGLLRPSWDNGTLSDLGFRDIVNDLDITDRVWDEKERLLYGATPMFMVVASKAS